MKIKSDFVTNSSSSSFVAWGVLKDDIELSNEAYLKIFQTLLKTMQKCAEEFKSPWRLAELEKMRKLETDAEKINYVRDADNNSIYDPFSVGGQDYGFVGLCPTELERNFPEIKIGEIRAFVASMFNRHFGTSFTEKDIQYYEEGWYDG